MRLVLIVLLLLPGVALAQQGDTEPITEACSEDPEIGFWYGELVIDAPPSLAGSYITGAMANSGDVPWSDTTGLLPPGTPGNLVIARDPGEPGNDPDEACTPLTNADEVAGHVALIRRGACAFSLKALHAQEAGAIGFVVYNDERPDFTDYQIVNMAAVEGSGEQVVIPGVFASRYLGNMIVDAIEDDDETIAATVKYHDCVECNHSDCEWPLSDEGEVPKQGAELTAYPSPFVHSTQVHLALDRTQRVTVTVYDALGRRVATLHDGPLVGGTTHAFVFDAGGLPGGVYVVRAEGETFARTRRVVLAR